jgi:hypothetical protein
MFFAIGYVLLIMGIGLDNTTIWIVGIVFMFLSWIVTEKRILNE